MSKIMFSLLVHEEPIVILDQVVNILKFNPNSYIIIHFNENFNGGSENFSKQDLFDKLSHFPQVIINPNTVRVAKDDIIQAHILNYNYVKNMDFDYFYFIASNELFLKSGAEDFVQNFDFGCEMKKKENWHYYDLMTRDESLKQILCYLNSNEYYYSQIEGSFYSKEVMEKVCLIIEEFYDCNNMVLVYPRDEVYFSTIACNIFKDKKRFDGCLCKIKWQGKILFTSLSTIKKILNFKIQDKYSVKRVDRKINNYLRFYIRFYKVKYENELRKYCDFEFNKISLLKIHLIDFFLRIKYFIRNVLANAYRFIFKKK